MIEFHRLRVVNLGWWKDVTLPLYKQGIVGVIGRNGSGKTTLFSRAIVWAIYGKTTENFKVSELTTNKNPCYVRLDFCVNSTKYMLVRFRNHSTYGNKVILRGKGIPQTDEDSLVVDVQGHINRLFGISDATFGTTVIFSQRRFNYFHSLSDFGKKEFLESLTYGSLFSQCETVVRERVKILEQKISRLEGELHGLQISLEGLLAENKQILEDAERRIEKYERQKAAISKKIDEHEAEIEDLEKRQVQYQRFVNEHRERIGEIDDLRQRINHFSQLQNTTCLTCYSEVTQEHKENILAKFQKSLQYKQQRAKMCEKYYKEYEKLEYEKETLYGKISLLEDAIQNRNILIKEIGNSKRDFSNIEKLQSQIRQVKKEIFVSKHKIEYEKFWVKAFSFTGLRSLVLGQVIHQVNELTNRYLHQVAGNNLDKLSLTFAKNRLLSEFGSRSYNTLSGGEKQLVDLCTGLAIREAAENHNKARFNLLVLDEPCESLDSTYQSKAQDLLFSVAKPTTFLVTHQSLDMTFSKLYEVTRKNGYSHLRKIYG